jgi:hypothetical protein
VHVFVYTPTSLCVQTSGKHTHVHGSQVWQGERGARQRRRQENGSEALGAGGKQEKWVGREHGENTKGTRSFRYTKFSIEYDTPM